MREQRVAVGERQHARFLAVQPLFDDELIAGVAEFLLHGDALDRRRAPARDCRKR